MEEGLKDYGTERVRVGEVLKGEIVSVNDKEIAVNVGYRADGIVPAAELPGEGTAEYKVGDRVDVLVTKVNDAEGSLELSVKKALSIVVWDELSEKMQSGDTFEVKVKEVVKGGLIAHYNSARVFIPASQAAAQYTEDLSGLVGTKFKVRLIELDVEKKKVVASRKVVEREELDQVKKHAMAILKVGQVVNGVVARLEPFGAFVDLGGYDGLVHVSNMSWRRINHPSELLKVGDHVEAEIIKIDSDKEKISLKLTNIGDNPWESIQQNYKIGGVYHGVVGKMLNYGVFIRLDDGVEGLCHISELSDQHVKFPSDVVSVGQEVEARVIAIDPAAQKISLSLKEARDERVEDVEEVEEDNELIFPGLGVKPTTLADLFNRGTQKREHSKRK